jgi:hypothetical protein
MVDFCVNTFNVPPLIILLAVLILPKIHQVCVGAFNFELLLKEFQILLRLLPAALAQKRFSFWDFCGTNVLYCWLCVDRFFFFLEMLYVFSRYVCCCTSLWSRLKRFADIWSDQKLLLRRGCPSLTRCSDVFASQSQHPPSLRTSHPAPHSIPPTRQLTVGCFLSGRVV